MNYESDSWCFGASNLIRKRSVLMIFPLLKFEELIYVGYF
jgi:hypothetical protein